MCGPGRSVHVDFVAGVDAVLDGWHVEPVGCELVHLIGRHRRLEEIDSPRESDGINRSIWGPVPNAAPMWLLRTLACLGSLPLRGGRVRVVRGLRR